MKFEAKIILKAITTLMLLSCIFFSFITYTINVENLFFLKFLTISEVFGVVAVGFFIVTNLKNIVVFREINIVYKMSFLLVISFGVGLLVTKELKSTLLAVTILMYLLLLSFAIYNTFKNDFLFLVKIIIVTFLALSIVGFYDHFAFQYGLITIFPINCSNCITSGFRYFGQTGDYTFLMLTFLLPFQFSNLSLLPNRKWLVEL